MKYIGCKQEQDSSGKQSKGGIKKQKIQKQVSNLQSAFVSGETLIHSIRHQTKQSIRKSTRKLHQKVKKQETFDYDEQSNSNVDESATEEENQIRSEQHVPTTVMKLFNEHELFLDQCKASVDMRLPSTRLMQDNMLTTLRLLNCHPFAPILRIQDVGPNQSVSLDDLPYSIKQNVVCTTDQFSHLMRVIFERTAERLTKLHKAMRDIVNKEKANFIRTSQNDIVNGLLALEDTSERKEMLSECELFVENSNSSSNHEQPCNLRIDLTIVDADKVLKLRRMLATRKLHQTLK